MNDFKKPQAPEPVQDTNQTGRPKRHKIDWLGAMPYLWVHLMALCVLWVGFSWTALVVCLFLYALRMFAITAFYHRYFSHRTFRTSRVCQFFFAALGCTALQQGPLWWAAHHRHHHKHSDDCEDMHSPKQVGFWWSHWGWFLAPDAAPTNWKLVPDLAKFPELRWLDRYHYVPAIVLAAILLITGTLFAAYFPHWQTNGWQLLMWGFLSTVAVYHATYLVNSVSHVVGRRRYQTKDDSRNNFWVAILTFGEGWHNNHHHYPNSVRQGFFWWEIDMAYYLLKAMSWLGLVWDLRPVAPHMLHRNLASSQHSQQNQEAQADASYQVKI
ncbi:MAG: acyl-CoA desaturase [Gemmataceae bacterium]